MQYSAECNATKYHMGHGEIRGGKTQSFAQFLWETNLKARDWSRSLSSQFYSLSTLIRSDLLETFPNESDDFCRGVVVGWKALLLEPFHDRSDRLADLRTTNIWIFHNKFRNRKLNSSTWAQPPTRIQGASRLSWLVNTHIFNETALMEVTI